jgi:prepilin-type N-terminal cleavage/methylation domain-containing protein
MNEKGFSLIEVIVAIVLLGIIAAGLAAFIYPNTDFYERNVAGSLAEGALEDSRKIAATNFNGLLTTVTTNTIVNTNGTNQTYTCRRTGSPFIVNAVQNGPITNVLTPQTTDTNTNPPPVIQVTITVSITKGGSTVQVLQRQAYFAR